MPSTDISKRYIQIRPGDIIHVFPEGKDTDTPNTVIVTWVSDRVGEIKHRHASGTAGYDDFKAAGGIDLTGKPCYIGLGMLDTRKHGHVLIAGHTDVDSSLKEAAETTGKASLEPEDDLITDRLKELDRIEKEIQSYAKERLSVKDLICYDMKSRPKRAGEEKKVLSKLELKIGFAKDRYEKLRFEILCEAYGTVIRCYSSAGTLENKQQYDLLADLTNLTGFPLQIDCFGNLKMTVFPEHMDDASHQLQIGPVIYDGHIVPEPDMSDAEAEIYKYCHTEPVTEQQMDDILAVGYTAELKKEAASKAIKLYNSLLPWNEEGLFMDDDD